MKNKILLVLTIIFGLIMVIFGLNKFLNFMPAPKLSPEMMTVFMAIVTIKWVLPLVAIAEIAGGILIAIPKYRALGAIIIFPVMVGILVHHLTHDPAGTGLGLILFIINVWVIIENKELYLHMIK